jgi:hypothetical protein
MKCTNGHDRCYLGPSENCPYCIKDQPRDERGRFIKKCSAVERQKRECAWRAIPIPPQRVGAPHKKAAV